MTHHHAPRRPARRLLAVAAAGLLACGGAAHAQTTAPAVPPEGQAPARTTPEQPTQRIHHEDALTRVDELRVGGETRSITVQPKNGAPAYEVTPASGREAPDTASQGGTGKSRWRLFDF